MQPKEWGVGIFANGWRWPVLALTFTLLAARAGCPETLLASSGQLRSLAQVASDTAEVSPAHPPRMETKEERRAKSKARLLAGGAMAVLSLLVLAVGLALVRAFKR
jgi:hypothetical protein